MRVQRGRRALAGRRCSLRFSRAPCCARRHAVVEPAPGLPLCPRHVLLRCRPGRRLPPRGSRRVLVCLRRVGAGRCQRVERAQAASPVGRPRRGDASHSFWRFCCDGARCFAYVCLACKCVFLAGQRRRHKEQHWPLLAERARDSRWRHISVAAWPGRACRGRGRRLCMFRRSARCPPCISALDE